MISIYEIYSETAPFIFLFISITLETMSFLVL